MGASSVTGVSGPGSAAEQGKGNKGSEHMSLGVHRLIGPRVVMCGDVMLNGGGHATVYYPELVGGADLYCPFLSTGNATLAHWGTFGDSSFLITGASEATVCWEIVKKGIWGSTTTDLENT